MCRHRLLRRPWLRNALKRLRLSHRASANRRAIRLKRKVTALRVLSSSNTVTRPAARTTANTGDKIIIAIDAGHGGQDPGAIGPGGTREKNVTIAIARKLRTLLNDDPMFKGVLTRDGDYFISVMGRSDVARKQNANFLVSIHADAAPNRSATGASVSV